MKKAIILLAILFAGVVTAFAQSAITLPYQSVVRYPSNRLVHDTTFKVQITIFENSVQKYYEEHNVTSDRNGMVSFLIGTGTSTSGSLSDVTDWSNASITQSYSLSTGVVTFTENISAVPYALQAANAATSAELSNLENRVNIFNTNVCDSVAECLDGANNNLSKQIIRIVNDTIALGTSATNRAIDSIVSNNLSGYSIQDCEDVNACVASGLRDESSTTNRIVDSLVRQNVLDSLANSASTMNRAIDTIVSNNLSGYSIQDCEDVNACVASGLRDGSSTTNRIVDSLVRQNVLDSLANSASTMNRAIDTIVSNNLSGYSIQDCNDVNDCVASGLRDESSTTNRIVDSLVRQNVLDSLANSASTMNRVIDTITANNIHDSLTNLRTSIPSVNNSTVSIQLNGIEISNFTLNQSSDATINIELNENCEKFSAAAGQISFPLEQTPKTNFAVKMFVNGVYVGSTKDGVVTLSGRTATYNSTANGGYTLIANDRVQFVYFY